MDLVLPTLLNDTERDLLRKELSWLGYGLAGTGLMARPGTETRGLRETLTEMQLTDKVVVMSARTQDWDGETAQQLTAALYRRVYLQSEIYLRTVLETEAGELPEAVPETRLRFGGI